MAGLGHDPTLTLLTRTIVQVGRDLGMQVVAEGIEQPRQLAELREMGCGYGQGFLVARPMAAAGVEALIRTANGGEQPGPDSAGNGRRRRRSGRGPASVQDVPGHGQAGRPRRVNAESERG